jgi:hypothetical protein
MNNQDETFMSTKYFISPTKSFKQYLSTVINSITDNFEGKEEENILNEDINGNDKQFSLA